MDQGSWRDLRPKPKSSQETLRTLAEVRWANMRDTSKHPYPGSEQVSDTQVEASSLARSLNRDDVAKMIFISEGAHTLAAAIKKDELYKSLLKEAESAAIDSQLTKILGTIDNCHEACYAGDSLARLKEEQEDAADHKEIAVEEGQVKAYKDLAKALQEYYDIIKNVKAKIEIKLYLLAPDGALEKRPELSLHNMLNDAKTFISNNIEEIVTNTQTEISYKTRVIRTIDRLPKTGVQYLGEVLGNKANHPYLRRAAAGVLGKIRDKEAIKALGEVLGNKAENLVLRIAAANALGGSDDREAIKALGEVLGNKAENLSLRSAAADALGKIRDREAIKALGEVLGNKDEDLHLRLAAAIALGKIRDKDTVPDLVKVFHDTAEDLHLRIYAFCAYIKIDNSKAALPDLGKVLLDKDEDLVSRRAAAEALGERHGKDAVPYLVKVLDDTDNHSDLRKNAARVLGRIAERQEGTIVPDSNLIKALGKVLLDKDEDLDLRITAANAFRGSGDKEAIKALGKVLLDKDNEYFLRITAANAFRGSGDKEAIKALGKVLLDKDEDLDLRIAATNALRGSVSSQKSGADPLVNPGQKRHDESSSANLPRNIEMIRGSGNKEAIKALGKVLGNKAENLDLRRAAANALGGSDDKEAIKALGKAHYDTGNHPDLHEEALCAFKKMDDETLIKVLTGKRCKLRTKEIALKALVEQNDKPSIKELMFNAEIDTDTRCLIAQAVDAWS